MRFYNEEMERGDDLRQLERELKADAMLDLVRRDAPESCRNCDHLVVGVEDNRFDHEFGVSGEIDYFPKCDVTNEEVFFVPVLDGEECEIKKQEEESHAKRTA